MYVRLILMVYLELSNHTLTVFYDLLCISGMVFDRSGGGILSILAKAFKILKNA